MHEVVSMLLGRARHGITDTQVEFGTLISASPLSIKLDEDPEPLEPEEIVKMKRDEITVLDVGKRYALLRCTSGQYLILGEVG